MDMSSWDGTSLSAGTALLYLGYV